ncbi:MAG: hypothetical protein DMG06_02250 [Acidobacteria bacterium]|nr:MAG: hypothetical protein DMG06_02250 [Acidobacteriota bacterium]
MEKTIGRKMIEDDSEIVVTGKDMFGAPFSEKTKLLNLSKEQFSFSLFRPVAENSPLQVNFHPDAQEACFWVRGTIIQVKNRLDGMQTVGVAVLECTN